jgi:hypothetical protein
MVVLAGPQCRTASVPFEGRQEIQLRDAELLATSPTTS